MKYEYRRNQTSIAMMLSAILLLQGFFLFSVFKKDVNLVIPASMLLIFAASICVLGMLIYSVALYSRELGAKTSYLTFMTPNPVVKILGSKLLSALLLGLFFALILGAFAAWDFTLVAKVFPEIELGRVMMEQMLASLASTDLATILTTISAMGIEFLINFFTVVVVSYLAITLSATALQNKKFKGLVSFLIFVAIMTALQWGTSLLPSGTNHKFLIDALLSAWPKYAVYLCVMVGSFALSAWLLEKKVSL
jgi:ABC-2 type transport system permease protein